jgi:hypothetical protein
MTSGNHGDSSTGGNFGDGTAQVHVKARLAAEAEAEVVVEEAAEAGDPQLPPPAVGTRVRKLFDDGEWWGLGHGTVAP